MAIGLTDEIHYSRIAGAIRALHGGTESYTPAEMAAYLATQGKELKPENIKKGITIFGVLGTLEYTGDSEPTPASYYLYGTPSESGNVAIAEGDGYTLYNGAVLPPLPETELPYAFIQTAELAEDKWLYLLSAPLDTANTGTFTGDYANVAATTGERYVLTDGAWVFDREIDGGVSCSYAKYIWGNFDVPYIDGGIYQAASAPIPLASNEPVAAVYGGVKLPVLPAEIKAYQYLTINRLTASGENADTFIVIGFAEEPQTIVKTNFISGDYDVFGTESGAYRGASCYTDTEPDVWYVSDEADGGTTVNFNLLVWSNCTVNTSGGELFMAATDPIPIYEKKE